MKKIFRRIIQNIHQKYYLVNFHGDIIYDNLTKKDADRLIKEYKKEKLYACKELNFY